MHLLHQINTFLTWTDIVNITFRTIGQTQKGVFYKQDGTRGKAALHKIGTWLGNNWHILFFVIILTIYFFRMN